MKVAILHNLRPQGYNTAVPDDAFEEYDSCETVAAIGGALARMGVRPAPVIADARLPRRLEDGEFDFAFNIAEGQGRRCRGRRSKCWVSLLRDRMRLRSR